MILDLSEKSINDVLSLESDEHEKQKDSTNHEYCLLHVEILFQRKTFRE